jgi:hypothetical protein
MVLVVRRTTLRPGHWPGPALNGVSAGWAAAVPSSQISGVNRSAPGRESGSRWKNGVQRKVVVPFGPQPERDRCRAVPVP